MRRAGGDRCVAVPYGFRRGEADALETQQAQGGDPTQGSQIELRDVGSCTVLGSDSGGERGGTLIQYSGRLHRLHPNKAEVRIYDYVDREVPMLMRMFEKRLPTYRAIGYARGEAPLGTPNRSKSER